LSLDVGFSNTQFLSLLEKIFSVTKTVTWNLAAVLDFFFDPYEAECRTVG
jgi:hypothetical protein